MTSFLICNQMIKLGALICSLESVSTVEYQRIIACIIATKTNKMVLSRIK
jgi:hypothetical protein